jgi:hypothetical protein
MDATVVVAIACAVMQSVLAAGASPADSWLHYVAESACVAAVFLCLRRACLRIKQYPSTDWGIAALTWAAIICLCLIANDKRGHSWASDVWISGLIFAIGLLFLVVPFHNICILHQSPESVAAGERSASNHLNVNEPAMIPNSNYSNTSLDMISSTVDASNRHQMSEYNRPLDHGIDAYVCDTNADNILEQVLLPVLNLSRCLCLCAIWAGFGDGRILDMMNTNLQITLLRGAQLPQAIVESSRAANLRLISL